MIPCLHLHQIYLQLQWKLPIQKGMYVYLIKMPRWYSLCLHLHLHRRRYYSVQLKRHPSLRRRAALHFHRLSRYRASLQSRAAFLHWLQPVNRRSRNHHPPLCLRQLLLLLTILDLLPVLSLLVHQYLPLLRPLLQVHRRQ